jgi:hypothetical protein
MMLDLTNEPLQPLATIASWIPPAHGGRKTHLSTVLRWILKGARAHDGTKVRLEAVRLGGRWMSSREAFQRFAERLTPRFEVTPPAIAGSPMARTKAAERAEKELERMGV